MVNKSGIETCFICGVVAQKEKDWGHEDNTFIWIAPEGWIYEEIASCDEEVPLCPRCQWDHYNEPADFIDEAELDSAVRLNVLEELWTCERAQAAWAEGTMTEDDYREASESEFVVDDIKNTIRELIENAVRKALEAREEACNGCSGETERGPSGGGNEDQLVGDGRAFSDERLSSGREGEDRDEGHRRQPHDVGEHVGSRWLAESCGGCSHFQLGVKGEHCEPEHGGVPAHDDHCPQWSSRGHRQGDGQARAPLRGGVQRRRDPAPRRRGGDERPSAHPEGIYIHLRDKPDEGDRRQPAPQHEGSGNPREVLLRERRRAIKEDDRARREASSNIDGECRQTGAPDQGVGGDHGVGSVPRVVHQEDLCGSGSSGGVPQGGRCDELDGGGAQADGPGPFIGAEVQQWLPRDPHDRRFEFGDLSTDEGATRFYNEVLGRYYDRELDGPRREARPVAGDVQSPEDAHDGLGQEAVLEPPRRDRRDGGVGQGAGTFTPKYPVRRLDSTILLDEDEATGPGGGSGRSASADERDDSGAPGVDVRDQDGGHRPGGDGPHKGQVPVGAFHDHDEVPPEGGAGPQEEGVFARRTVEVDWRIEYEDEEPGGGREPDSE